MQTVINTSKKNWRAGKQPSQRCVVRCHNGQSIHHIKKSSLS